MIPVQGVVGVVHEQPQFQPPVDSSPAFVTFVMASTSRYADGEGRWHEGEKTLMRVKAYRSLAENVAHCLPVGARIVVNGRLYNRSYEGRPGPAAEIEADEIAASLRFTRLVLADRQDLGLHAKATPPDEAFEETR